MSNDEMLSEKVRTTELLKAVTAFKKASARGEYYQRENNQNAVKKHREPTKTLEWEANLSNLLQLTEELSQEGWHQTAVDCYHLLFDCIAFAFDEERKGVLVIRHQEEFLDDLNELQREATEPYIISLAKTATPYDYADRLIPFIVADYPCCESRAYEIAIREANTAQRAELDKQITKREVKITMAGEYYGDFDY
jgi:hypothetical protein